MTFPSTADIIADLEGSGIGLDVLVNNMGHRVFETADDLREKEARAQMKTSHCRPLSFITVHAGKGPGCVLWKGLLRYDLACMHVG